MSRLYASPLRVYLCLAALAVAGIWSGFQLPVSLFPNSSKPLIGVNLSYGSSTAEEFINLYGSALESQLRAISTEEVAVEKLRAYYEADSAHYEVEFKWGASPRIAQREVEMVANAFSARLPEEVRDSLNTWTRNEDAGFLAVSFYSSKRSLDETYQILEPVLNPPLAQVQDASEPEIWNPTKKEIRIELIPEKMASLQLFPRDIDQAIRSALGSHSGGAVTVATRQFTVQMPRAADTIDDLSHVLVPTPLGRAVHLTDVARIDFGQRLSQSRSFKTSGQPSLILFASPRPGGNVKRMSEDILEIISQTMVSLPKDIHYRVLVDPSEFIRASVNNVFHEVLIGALLAVVVLFLFIGSFKNTVTAAIEIPLSMVLAFILMRMSGMNLNLISLGGLALSAGMNVDASVVVMENIFRHFEERAGAASLSFQQKLAIITQAVSEVRFAVIASTIASLVVFLPLAFTSDLSYAVLGDLAKTVVFSHGFSAFVALILVPTVRLHLMAKGKGIEKPHRPPIEAGITRLERAYAAGLGAFISRRRLQLGVYGALALLLVVLGAAVLPRLPREVIGKPDTDWMILSINTQGNLQVKQMETQTDEFEAKLLAKFGPQIQYTFVQVQGANRASVMSRLKDKAEMHTIWKEMEAIFTNTPTFRFWVGPWNPAELPIPNPPQLRIVVRGGELEDRAEVAQQIQVLMQENEVFPRIWTEPDVSRVENIVLRPDWNLWGGFKGESKVFGPEDLADLARVATTGRKVGMLTVAGHNTDIFLRYPEASISTAEDLGALPIGIGSKIVPLQALARVGVEKVAPTVYREDQESLFAVFGKEPESEAGANQVGKAAAVAKAGRLIEDWKKKIAASGLPQVNQPSVYLEDAEKDLHQALRQLGGAVGLSILLIFMTLVIQFGGIVDALLVLVAVPLGLIGVLVSLWVFQSTLSLNSILGVILLNGIAVANSIILVDFMKRLVAKGMSPAAAAVEAGRKRLRPILITSLTTILGMMPIALGMGEGGRILQPLGIAVSGGLWVSMALTLFVVPALQARYLQWQGSRANRRAQDRFEPPVPVTDETFVFPAGATTVAPNWIEHSEPSQLQ